MPAGHRSSRWRKIVYSQIFLKGNPADWYPVIRESIVAWLELIPLSIPYNLPPSLSFDPAAVAVVVYVQLGLLLLGYVFRRSVRDLRAQLLSLEARYESSLREQTAHLADLAGQVKTPQAGPETASRNEVPLIPAREHGEKRTVLGRRLLAADNEPARQPRAVGPPVASTRRKVVEMAGQGAATLRIADSLDLRPAEVDLLLRVHLLQQSRSGGQAT
jgi:hypothetical protein